MLLYINRCDVRFVPEVDVRAPGRRTKYIVSRDASYLSAIKEEMFTWLQTRIRCTA
jgi:hypothetical protein